MKVRTIKPLFYLTQNDQTIDTRCLHVHSPLTFHEAAKIAATSARMARELGVYEEDYSHSLSWTIILGPLIIMLSVCLAFGLLHFHIRI
jgi:hypothetical protein